MVEEVFPQWMIDLWNKWEIRAMVLISLFLQIILIFIGNRRKYIAGNWIRIIVWFSYLSADWVATVALGVLSRQQGENDYKDLKNQLIAFWAPFLLLHLGGPDTITAYALEDNELWLRHLLGLIVQLGFAIYVFIMSWRMNWLSFVNFPIFVAGIIKYGERTWVLMSASSDNFRDSMLTPPDPGPNYAKIMEEYESKKAEGFMVSVEIVKEVPQDKFDVVNRDDDISNTSILLDSYYFFESFKRIFADLILSYQDRDNSISFFLKSSWKEAFEVIEVELGFMYDILYTKASVVYTYTGCILRFTSLSSTISAFVVFSVSKKHWYHELDIIITYLLLGVAILLEIYAILLHLSSDWANVWLIKHENKQVMIPISRVIHSIQLPKGRNWSNSMSQYNLIGFCLKEKALIFPKTRESLCVRYENVTDDLKKTIYEQLEKKSTSIKDFRDSKNLCTRGNWALERNGSLNEFGWSISEELDQCILLWHISTDICCYLDQDKDLGPIAKSKYQMSKLVSNYMLYLLVMRPYMLPIGIGQIRFQDTCAEAIEFFQERKPVKNIDHACKILHRVNTDIPPIGVKGDRSKSVLFDACRLAKSLQQLDEEVKWEVTSQVWVEMLSYAASNCQGNRHAQQLRRGGELLTHVWLLMAHLGMTQHFQISPGHGGAKLILQ